MPKNKKQPSTPVSNEAMEQLVRIMNDTPTIIKLQGTDYAIHALKPGTQWLIAEEASKIVRQEQMTMGDVLKEFAVNLPSVCRVITLAMLNDKERINDKDEYQKIYDTLLWGDVQVKDWAMLLFEILQMLDTDFFFASTNVIATLRRQTLERKTTMTERKSFPQEQNGDK